MSQLAIFLLALLSVGHGWTGLALLRVAGSAMVAGEAAGVLAGVFYGFFGLLLLAGAAIGLRAGWRLSRGDDAAVQLAVFLLIAFAVTNLLSPVGGGPLLRLLDPGQAIPVRVGVSAAALLVIWLLRRGWPDFPRPDPQSPR